MASLPWAGGAGHLRTPHTGNAQTLHAPPAGRPMQHAAPLRPRCPCPAGLQNQLLLALEPEVLRAVNWRIYAIAEAVLGLDASRGECAEEEAELECPNDPAELDCQ